MTRGGRSLRILVTEPAVGKGRVSFSGDLPVPALLRQAIEAKLWRSPEELDVQLQRFETDDTTITGEVIEADRPVDIRLHAVHAVHA